MSSAAGTREEYASVRRHCGYFFLDDWGMAMASGPDLWPYLQTQTTNDITQIQLGGGQNSAIIDRKGKLIASFSIHGVGVDAAVFLSEREQTARLCQHLEAFRFRENITIAPQPPQDALLSLQGPKSRLLAQKLLATDDLPLRANEVRPQSLWESEVFIFHKSLTGEEGYILALPTALRETLAAWLEREGGGFNARPVSAAAREILRIEYGLPLFGRDMDADNVLPETGLEHTSVSYNKGCYIGQEVIARIKTYGAPAHALAGLTVESGGAPPFNGGLFLGAKRIGSVKSVCFSHALNKTIALAYLHKDYRAPDTLLDVCIGGEFYQVKTVLLPFVPPRTRAEHARSLHQEALQIYKTEDLLDKPIALLREAIALDPACAAAYEALGVFLSKQNLIDEAIAVMKRLAEIDPTEIMAHTNLSIFYMQQGKIEEAEKEKAEATALQFDKLLANNMAQKARHLAEEAKRADQERKAGMFRQVLAIDPADQVANFGLGSIYLDMGRLEDALPHFNALVTHYPNYSAAYLLLGKTLEKLTRREEALQTYKTGMAVAARKGDLMPLREMQTRHNQLLHSAN